MGVFKSLVDKVQQKKEEIEEQAAKMAAEKAAEMAVERGKQVALAAVEQAGRTLKTAGASIEEALFGPDSEAASGDGEEPRRAAGGERRSDDAERQAKVQAPRRTAASLAADEERLQREVDDELAALKRKLAGR